MLTSKQLINLLKNKYNLTSDGQAAQKIGVTRSSISKIQNNKGFWSPEVVITFAELLEIDFLYCLACIEIERATKLNNQKSIKAFEKFTRAPYSTEN